MGITEIDAIFSTEDFSFIKSEFEKSSFKNNLIWGDDVKHFSKPVKISEINNKDIITLISDTLKNINISPLNKNVMKGCLFYKWEPGCYIPWHGDSNHSAGLTIYLNDDWNYKNGGLFLYKENNDIKTIIPQKNKGVLQVGGVPHSTTIVSKYSKPRKTLQIFFDKFNEVDSYII